MEEYQRLLETAAADLSSIRPRQPGETVHAYLKRRMDAPMHTVIKEPTTMITSTPTKNDDGWLSKWFKKAGTEEKDTRSLSERFREEYLHLHQYTQGVQQEFMERPAEKGDYYRDTSVRGRDFTMMVVDEFAEEDMAKTPQMSPEAIEALKALAESITVQLGAIPSNTTLLTPMSLTVHQQGRGFIKKNHTGGEEFTVTKCRVGSAAVGSRLLFELVPLGAEGYQYAEVMEGDLIAHFDQGRSLLDDVAPDGDYAVAVKAVRNIDSKARQAQEIKDKADDYPEYGSF